MRYDENCLRERKSVKKDGRAVVNLVVTQEREREREDEMIRDVRGINRRKVAFVIIISPQSFRGYGLE